MCLVTRREQLKCKGKSRKKEKGEKGDRGNMQVGGGSPKSPLANGEANGTFHGGLSPSARTSRYSLPPSFHPSTTHPPSLSLSIPLLDVKGAQDWLPRKEVGISICSLLSGLVPSCLATERGRQSPLCVSCSFSDASGIRSTWL